MNERRALTVDEVDYIYVDSGCDVSPSCLRCPLAVCRYDEPIHQQRASLNEAKARQLVDEGWNIEAIARGLGVSRRTVHRYLREEA